MKNHQAARRFFGGTGRQAALALVLVLCAALLALPALSASAVEPEEAASLLDVYGNFTYTANGSGVTVTGWTGSGDLAVPSTLNGMPVTAIGSSAFKNRGDLTSVTIPNSVTLIEDYAFYNCPNITSFIFPASAAVTGNTDAFTYCTGVTYVRLTGSGEMAAYTGSRMPWGRTNQEIIVTMDEGITTISDGAFRDSPNLSSITMPSTLLSIGTGAFQNDSGLVTADLPAGVTSIGASAFQGCASLRSADLPSGLTVIRESTFNNCTGLAGNIIVPAGVTEIQDYAFYNCPQVTHFTIPAGVVLKGNTDAFTYCTGVTSARLTGSGPMAAFIGSRMPWGRTNSEITVTMDEGITSISDGAFRDSPNLTSITMPSTLLSIGTGAFQNDNGLVTADLPAGVTAIGPSVFQNCASLRSADLPSGLTIIRESTFKDCTGLTGDIVVPAGVTEIQDYAFYNCPQVAHFTLPAGAAMSRNTDAFTYCTGVTHVRLTGSGPMAAYTGSRMPWGRTNQEITVTMDEGITTISDGAFRDSPNLRSITLPSTLLSIGTSAFQNDSGLVTADLPSGVTAIGASAFQSCASLLSANLPAGLTIIEESTFKDCTGLTGEVVVPAGVTEIKDYAFYNCPQVTHFTIPAGAFIAGNTDAFTYCTGVTSVRLTGSGPMAAYTGSRMPWGRTNQAVTVTMDEGITTITDNAFRDSPNLRSIILPDSLASIGTGAFQNDTGLVTADIPAGVTSIGASAFQSCASLLSVNLPSGLTVIETSTFNGCTSLTGSVDIPAGVAEIKDYAFYNCPRVTHFTIPAGVSIGGNTDAFTYCTGVTTVRLSGSGDMAAFTGSRMPWGRTNQRVTVTLDSGITSISANAFNGCGNVAEITIPLTVQSFENGAFQNCNGLTDVWYEGNQAQWGQIMKGGSNDRLISTAVTIHYGTAMPSRTFTVSDARSDFSGSRKQVAASVYCEKQGVTAYCVFYDARGRALDIQKRALNAGGNTSLSFSTTQSAVSAKLLFLNAAMIPQTAGYAFP